MGFVPVFHGTFDELGGFHFERPSDVARFGRAVGAGVRQDVTFREFKSQRSNQQSRWERKAIALLADELGWDKQDRDALHYYMLTIFGGTHRNEKTGVDIPNIPHSAKLNTKRFAEFQDFIVRWAAVEHGIYVPMDDFDYEAAS